MKMMRACMYVLLVMCISWKAYAGTITQRDAEQAVIGWLQTGNVPLGQLLGTGVRDSSPLYDNRGAVVLYVVYLQPDGIVLVAPDDRIEPILAFMPGAQFEANDNNPLYTLAMRDLEMLLAELPDESVGLLRAEQVEESAAQAKWQLLEQFASGELVRVNGISSVDDERVAPFIESEWNQRTYWDGSQYQSCYNYYAPPYGDGVDTNYPCGCVATVYAQLMRHFRYPSAGVGTGLWHIEIDGVDANWNLRGGNDAGGPYDYASMPLSPDGSTTVSERQAIGRLCHDAALVADMNFTASGSGGYMDPTNLTGAFMFSNALDGAGDAGDFWHMLNANLDARLPVPMSLTRATGGHLVLCDGYGYNLGTRYHHLNMGWGGTDNAWYNLPDVDAYFTYTNVERVTYNIYTNGTGEIISGRLTDPAGAAVSGAIVQAVAGGVTNQAVSDSNGIYALFPLLSDTMYALSVTGSINRFVSRMVQTGTSVDNGACGNRWSVNFYGQPVSSHVISGTIAFNGGLGVSGVVVTASGGTCVTSDASGYYIFTIPDAWSGTVNWTRPGFTFSPDSRSYSALSSNCLDENVEALHLVYVDADASGADNGSSWTDAYTNLVDAMGYGKGTAVLVAEGTYYPGTTREDYFYPSEGLILYGGFEGTEASVTQRNPSANTTVLSGDIGVPGNAQDNCYHVIYGDDYVIFDGFTITGGHANHPVGDHRQFGGAVYYNPFESPVLANCIISGNFATNGGGLYGGIASNCVFYGNDSGAYAAAAYKSILVNCLVYSNTAGQYSGGNMWGTNYNCTIVNNTAGTGAGGVYDCRNINCIIYDNTAGSWGDNYARGTNLYTCSQPFPAGAGNINSAPLFMGAASNDYRLAIDSPCIDQGDTNAAYGGLDVLGNSRIWDGGVDMGACEAIYLPVQAQAGTHGQVAPTGTQHVYVRDNCVFTNMADSYYHVGDVLVNGLSQGAFDVFTSSNILIAQTVSVVFAANTVTNVPGNVPEVWLVSYGWTNNFDAAAAADQDSDSMATWEEYVAGTVPTNSGSVFGINYSDGSSELETILNWQPCISNRTYIVDATSDMQTSFTNLAVLHYPVDVFTVLVDQVHTYYRVTVRQ